jgi:hypothetical protein
MLHPVLFLVMLPVLFLIFALFDRILWLQYHFHREDWERHEKPIGFFWLPGESSWWGGTFARNRCSREWIYKTPDWMRKDERALRLLYWYRWLGWVWIIGFMVIFSPLIISWLQGIFG